MALVEFNRLFVKYDTHLKKDVKYNIWYLELKGTITIYK